MENSRVVLTIVSLLCVSIVLLYRHLKDPLRRIPGPFLAKFSRAWIVLLELSGNRSSHLHKLHKQYGRVVRVAPNELCFSSPEALKDIYGASTKLVKAPIYESMGFRSTFTTIDRDEYRLKKKRILPSFSPAFVASLEPVVHRQANNLVNCLRKRVDIPLDVIPWFRMFALGVVGEGFAGTSFGGLEAEKTPRLLEDIDDVFPSLWVRWMFPTLSSVLHHSPVKGVREFLKAPDRFKKYGAEAYYEYLAQHDPQTRDDLIARFVNERSVLAEKDQSIPFHISETGIIEEVTNLLFAGTDTTGNTLTYLFWQLAHSSVWITRMRNELKQACGDRADPDYSLIAELPIMRAVLNELWRIWPASPGSLCRLTTGDGAMIDDVFVPGNVIVSCQPFTEQRNPIIFPDPDNFNPQRWLDAERTQSLEPMLEQLTLFGKGARSCLGRRLATMEIKLAMVAVVRNFDIEIGSATTDQDMEMTDHFVLIPKGGKCILRLRKIQE